MLKDQDDDIIINFTSSKPSETTKRKVDLKKQKYLKKKIQKNQRRSNFKDRSSNIYADNEEKPVVIPPIKENEVKQTIPVKKPTQKRPQERQNYRPARNNYMQSQQLQAEPIIKREDIKQDKVPLELLPSKNQTPQKNIYPVQNLQLENGLKNSLLENGYTKLTEIQSISFQPILDKKNCIIKAQTGSGKTLAYLIPILNHIIHDKIVENRATGTVAIVICPTRQLCIQAQKQAWKCVKRTPYIVPGSLMGGQSVKKQKSRLRKGLNILFCTPGRIEYHLQNTQSFKYDKLKFLIFEEADRTLDMGFKKQVNKILNILEEKLGYFESIQKILVSAHFNDKIEQLINNLNPSRLEYIGFKTKMNQQKQLQIQKQKQINISQHLKQTYVLVSQEQRIPFLISYLSVLHKCKILIFFSTIDQVEYFEFMFQNIKYRDSNGVYTDQNIQKRKVFKLHGDIEQKLRSKTYFDFRNENNSILISTQVASRGLDFPDLTHIILFDIPPTITDYANRIGRTARMNSTGVSLLILNYQESDYIEQLKVYTPKISPLQKDLIFQNFSRILAKMNIRSQCLYYLQGIIRGLVKDDQQKYALARKAYVSMLRAYARLPNKEIFVVKKLNLQLLAKNFGLNSVRSRNNEDNMPNKRSANNDNDYNVIRKKRKIQDVKQLQISQYL